MSKKEKDKVEEPELQETEETAAEEKAEAAGENPLEKELTDAKDQLLRVTAEYANFRKRSEKEKQDAFVFAKSDTVRELLPVVDNLERAISAENGDFEALKKGVEMTFENLMSILGKLGVEVYGKPGDIFDPNLHNAVMHVEDENYENGEIVDVFQKGYKINDKIIRPAMVKSAN